GPRAGAKRSPTECTWSATERLGSSSELYRSPFFGYRPLPASVIGSFRFHFLSGSIPTAAISWSADRSGLKITMEASFVSLTADSVPIGHQKCYRTPRLYPRSKYRLMMGRSWYSQSGVGHNRF